MAAPSRHGVELVRATLGFWRLSPRAARDWMAPLPSLVTSCQWRRVSCAVGAASSGRRLAPDSGRSSQVSALDRLLGFPQHDSSLTACVPAVSMHRGKGSREIFPATVTVLSTQEFRVKETPAVSGKSLILF